jgi:hypothetical protein
LWDVVLSRAKVACGDIRWAMEANLTFDAGDLGVERIVGHVPPRS